MCFLERAGSHGGCEDVGGGDQGAELLHHRRIAQVEQHRALVAVDGHEDRAEVLGRALGRWPAQRMMSPPPPRRPPGNSTLISRRPGRPASGWRRRRRPRWSCRDAHPLERAGGFGGAVSGAGRSSAPVPIWASQRALAPIGQEVRLSCGHPRFLPQFGRRSALPCAPGGPPGRRRPGRRPGRGAAGNRAPMTPAPSDTVCLEKA